MSDLLVICVIAGAVVIIALLVAIELSLQSNHSDELKYTAELEKMKHICSQCQSHKCNDCVWHNKTYY